MTKSVSSDAETFQMYLKKWIIKQAEPHKAAKGKKSPFEKWVLKA